MSVVLLAHLSDAHLRTENDTLMKRAVALARAIAGECDGSVTGCIIAFTGDATDKGFVPGFGVARQFVENLARDVERLTKLRPVILSIPGNHDVVRPGDSSLRDMVIGNLTTEVAVTRPTKALEDVILAALGDYFGFAAAVAPGGSPTKDWPYYVTADHDFGGKRVRFHLLNSSWMCTKGQGPGALLFPVSEIRPSANTPAPDYEITLLHHPFAWFRQPEAMRPLRDAVEAISDMILTGHEHVGRSMTAAVHGSADYEYREGEALQDGANGHASGFHILRLDFGTERQTVTSYKWHGGSSGNAYLREVGPVDRPLGRNRRRNAQPYRRRAKFEAWLEDPELPIMHSKFGALRLSDFYTYPDLMPVGEKATSSTSRVRGEKLVETISRTPKALLFGPDRCGKTSLAKRLCADLHGIGDLPLLLHASVLRSARPEWVGSLLEKLVHDQYEVLQPEAYWQTDPAKRVLIVDDLDDGPTDLDHRSELLAEIERRFDRIAIVGADDQYYQELLAANEDDRKANAMWEYESYRILPFGYLRCEQFVRNWVRLGERKPDEVEGEVRHINGLLTQFLRHNLIPQYPWVVMIIVQQIDSAEPLHAENGSYGYLLQALITAALAKSKLKLPIPGKYAWLGELANEMYMRDLSVLTDDLARSAHDRYCREYAVSDLDYKEIRDDLAAAGVLRMGVDEVSFGQAYTYCYFVAWHLAQRLHANDSVAREEVRALCKDLYDEDTANVLVFLAHLTTSPVVLEEMTGRAAQLFADSKETDFVTDVQPINNLYKKVQALILPNSDPKQNKIALQDHEDQQKAEKDGTNRPRREVRLRRTPEERALREKQMGKIMEIVTATRTIEILGQVLRNAATGRKADAMLEITKQVFNVGRRQLGYFFSVGGTQLETTIAVLEEHYRHRMPKAKVEDLVGEVSGHLFNLYTFVAFAVVKHVALAVGDRNLREVFRQVVEGDPNLANRIYKLGIDLETAPKPPVDDMEALNDELTGKSKKKGVSRTYNNVAHTVVRALVVEYMYLNHLPREKLQEICQKMRIEVPARAVDPATKRLPPPKR